MPAPPSSPHPETAAVALSVEAARARLAELAFARDSHLCRAARNWPEGRRDLFLAAYMAMRSIDDHVDGLPPQARGPASPALETIETWRRAVSGAAEGHITGTADATLQAALVLLAVRMPASPLDLRPFEALAGAMRHDAAGAPMADFDAWLAYAEGASVAPTYVFLLLLACDPSARRLAADIDPQGLWQAAQTFGRYCYMAHIVRDLAADAGGGPHLLTVPETWYRRHCRDRRELASHLLDPTGATSCAVRAAFVAQMDALRPAVDEAVRRFERAAGREAAAMVEAVLGAYRRLHHEARAETRGNVDPASAVR